MLLEGRHKVTRASDQQELAQAFESGFSTGHFCKSF